MDGRLKERCGWLTIVENAFAIEKSLVFDELSGVLLVCGILVVGKGLIEGKS